MGLLTCSNLGLSRNTITTTLREELHVLLRAICKNLSARKAFRIEVSERKEENISC